MQLGCNIGPVAEADSNGANLLNRLFWAKNQALGTPGREIYDKLIEAYSKISSGYRFWIDLGENQDLTLHFAYRNGSAIPASDCGLGLQDLLVILYFTIHPNFPVVLIEEPESHIHPYMQKKLLTYMKDETDKQFFLTTHSNVFLNNALVDRVYFTTFKEEITVDDATDRASILDDLGYSVTDNLVSDLVILVEGPTDVPVIEELLSTLGTMGRYDIKIWPLGGDIMDQVPLEVFAEKYAVLSIIDQDPGSAKIRKKFVEKCRAVHIPVTHLKRYSIENYFSINALTAVYRHQMPAGLIAINPDEKLETQLGIDVKPRNREIAKAMTVEEIECTDDLFRFLTKVERTCRDYKGQTTGG